MYECKPLFGGSHAAAKWALFCSLSCWFNFFCGVRTFSNCTEAVLTTAALSYWPWRSAPVLRGNAPAVPDVYPRHRLGGRVPGGARSGGGGGGGGGEEEGARGRGRGDDRDGARRRGEGEVDIPRDFNANDAGVRRVTALVLAAAACVIRPTAALYWLPLAVVEIWNNAPHRWRFVFGEAVGPGIYHATSSKRVFHPPSLS